MQYTGLGKLSDCNIILFPRSQEVSVYVSTV